MITTVTVTCMEVARLRPHFHRGKGGGADGAEFHVFGGGMKPAKVGSAQKATGGARETMSWGRTMGPRVGGKKHPPLKEIENAGLDDFWAAGFGDAETELEGGDVLVVPDVGKFVQKGGVSDQLEEGGGEEDQWEKLVSTPAVETIEGRDVMWQVSLPNSTSHVQDHRFCCASGLLVCELFGALCSLDLAYRAIGFGDSWGAPSFVLS